MGDTRFMGPYRRVAEAERPHEVIRRLGDDEVVAALAAASQEGDPYLSNVLATEAQNRMRRATTATSHLGEGVVTVDPDGRVVYVNPAAEAMLGYEHEDLMGADFHDLVHCREDGTPMPRGACAALRTLEDGQVRHRQGEDAFRRSDGTFFPVAFTAARTQREDETVGVVSVFRDITREKAAEDRRRRLAAIVESSPDAVVALNLEGVVTHWNPGAERLFGYTADEMVGQTITRLLPEDRRGDVALARRVMGGGEPETYETERLHKNGHRIPVAVTVAQLRNEHGEVVGLSAIFEDITERNRAQEALRESEERHRLLINQVQDYAIYLLDPEGRIQSWNRGAERIKGYTQEEILGQHLSTFYTPEDKERGHPQEVLEAAKREGRYEEEGWRVRKDGSRFWARITLTALRDPEGHLKGFAKVTRDLTPHKRAEEALRESEARKNAILQASLDAIITIDGESRILEWNPAAEAIFGHTAEDAIGQDLTDLIIPERYREAHRHGMARYLATGEGPVLGERIELPAIRIDGTEFSAEIAILPLHVNGRQLFTGYLRDVTERKHTRDELKRRAQQAAAVAELGQDALRNTRPQDLMEKAVHQLADLLEVEYTKVLELLPSGKELLLRAGVGWREGLVGQGTVGSHMDSQAGYTLRSRHPVVVRDLREEHRFRGPPLLREHGVVSGMSVIIGNPDHPWGVLGAHTTKERAFTQDEVRFLQGVANTLATALERARAEGKVAASEARYRALYEESPVMSFTVDPTGVIRSANRFGARYLGYTVEELRGRPLVSLFHPEDQAAARQQLDRFFENPGENAANWDGRKVRKDGSVLWVHEVIRGIPLETGEVHALVNCLDITRNKRADLQVREAKADLERRVSERTREIQLANQELEAFSYSVSHDLRGPLRGIEAYARVLEEDYADHLDAEGRDMVQRLRREGSRASRLVHDLLALSRASRTEMRREPVDLTKLATEVANDLRARDPDRPVEFRIQPDVTAEGDPRLLRQVLANLLDNAWKYTGHEPDAHIQFGVAHEDEGPVFFVRDNGVGFDPANAQGLFQAFKRLGTASEFEGTGIGLAIVHRILQRHGGRVWAESRPGEGATFFFTLRDHSGARDA